MPFIFLILKRIIKLNATLLSPYYYMKNTLLLVLRTLHNLSYHTTGLPESMDLGWSLEPDFFFGHYGAMQTGKTLTLKR